MTHICKTGAFAFFRTGPERLRIPLNGHGYTNEPHNILRNTLHNFHTVQCAWNTVSRTTFMFSTDSVFPHEGSGFQINILGLRLGIIVLPCVYSSPRKLGSVRLKKREVTVRYHIQLPWTAANSVQSHQNIRFKVCIRNKHVRPYALLVFDTLNR